MITKLSAPTSYFDKESNSLVVILEQGQLRALMQANLQRETEEAQFGRALLTEIKQLYETHCFERGAIGLRITPRKYDGEPV